MTEEKTNQASSKLKTFMLQTNAIKKVKGQPTEWKKIFANNITDKGAIARIYKELITQKEKC
jgi:hypothetical protein